MRYKDRAKDCQMIVRAKASFGETIDETALNAFSRVYIRGFFKARVVRKNVIEYTGPVGISLADRMKKLITKRDFFFILEHVVVAFQKIHANKLSMNNVLLDMRYVYINENTKEVQFLYVPSSKPKLNNDPLTFLESIIYSAKPASEKDMEYVSRTVYFLRNMKGFDPDRLEKFIYKEDRSVVNTIKKQNAGQSGFMTSKQRDYYDHYENKDKGPDGDDTALLEEEQSDSTALLDDEEATGLLEEENDNTALLDDEEATGLLDDGNEDDFEPTGLLMDPDGSEETSMLFDEEEEGTALLDDSEEDIRNEIHFPSLYRILTEETISINKPVFRIGKEKTYVDYFVTNNNAVSRSHADIVVRGSRYYVVDLNSKNRTYINNQPLQVQCETEIHDGDRLKLGNEEFIFKI